MILDLLFMYLGFSIKYSKSCSPVLMADKENYLRFKSKYLFPIQRQSKT